MSPNTEAARTCALRVGILHGDRLVEERVVTAAQVSVGSSPTDTFIVPPTPGLLRSRTLMRRAGAGYLLKLDGAIDGKLSTGRGRPVQTLAELMATAGAEREVILDDGARGSLRFGELRVLFQSIQLSHAARPQLPPSLRGRFVANLDWAMLAIATISLFGHMGFVAYLSQLDYPRRPSIEDIPERVVSTLIRGRIFPEKIDLPPIKEQIKQVKVVTPTKPRTPGPSHVRTEEEVRAEAIKKTFLMKQNVGKAVAQIITTRADGGSLVTDLIAAGSPSQNVDDVFNKVGSGISTTGRPVLGPRDRSGGPLARAGTGIRAGGVEEAARIARKEERIIKVPEPTTGPVSLDPGCDADKVAASIRQRKGAFTACYTKWVSRDASLAGKVVLLLDIAASGRIHHAEVRDETLHSEDMAACIEAAVSHWVFPDLGCGESHVEFPLFFTPPKQ